MFDGFMVVCYYYPAAKFGDYSLFLTGKPCDKCPESRPTCSRDFKTLCGIGNYYFHIVVYPKIHKYIID